MTKDEDFKLLKIQTCVLKVNIHCDGCKQKVKKLLQRIEGVFQVSIDADQQKVTVSGSVDSTILINKLTKAGKHAELWSPNKSNQNQKQKINFVKEDNNKNNQTQKQNLIKNLEALKNQGKFQAFNSEEDGYYTDDDEDEFNEDELRFLKEKMGLLEQQTNIAKKNAAAIAASNNNNNGKMHNNVRNLNAAKKGNMNQNVAMKCGPGIDQKTMATMKMNNAAAHLTSVNMNAEGQRVSDLGAMMNHAGFHGNNPNPAAVAAALGNHNNSLGNFQAQSSGNPAGFPNGGFTMGQYPSTMMMNMNGYNHPAATQLMMNNNIRPQQQPQMMYNRSPYIQPNTGYYYNSFYGPVPYSYYTENPNHHGDNHYQSADASHMYSDENTSSSCPIM
ncbi:hypothetical protein ACFE04_016910 [Oxalis oulophora]